VLARDFLFILLKWRVAINSFLTFGGFESVANFGTNYFLSKKNFLREINLNLLQNSQLLETAVG
jgi:hypothetical protein